MPVPSLNNKETQTMRKYIIGAVSGFVLGAVAAAHAQLIVDATIDAASVVGLDSFITTSTAVTDHEVRISALESAGAGTLNGLTDVVITTPVAGDVLVFDGANWIDNTFAEAGIGTASAVAQNASDISNRVVISGEAGNVAAAMWGGCTTDLPGTPDAATVYVHSDQSPPCP